MLWRIALGVLVLALVATAAGLLVSARIESDRADRLVRSTARTRGRTIPLQAQIATLERRAKSSELLEQRLESGAELLSRLDVAPLASYERVVQALNTLTSSVSDLVNAGATADAHASLDWLLRDARTRLAVFDKDMTKLSKDIDEIRSAVRAGRAR